jgi:putative hemolysin
MAHARGWWVVIWVSILVVAVLVLIEAVFAASEMALVSLREGQVSALAEKGRRGKKVADLVSNPNRFLSAVQIGVTTTALLSSAFGAITLSDSLARELRRAGMAHDPSQVIAFLIVTLAIAYVTLVVGELAPKRIALQRAEGTASLVAPTLDRFATLMLPVIWLLSVSTDAAVRLLGGDPTVGRETISEGELRDLVTGHKALTGDERQLIDDVFEAGERQVREIMVPRTEVEFFDGAWTIARAMREAQDSPHSRFPVVRGSHDDVIGFIHVRDLYRPKTGERRGLKLADLARDIAMVPASKHLLPAMSEMRRSGDHLAIVVDEYGGTAGIVTLEDLIEELVGDIRDEYDDKTDEPKQLRGGDIEVDGLLNLDDFADTTGIELPEGPYETVAGAIMATLGRVPRGNDAVELDGIRLKVTKMDGRRVARVRVSGNGRADSSPVAASAATTAVADNRDAATTPTGDDSS